MLKKLRRSIEEMPRPAYIFLKYTLLFCCILLCSSLILYLSSHEGFADYEKTKLAALMLETPAAILIISAICLAFILDRS